MMKRIKPVSLKTVIYYVCNKMVNLSTNVVLCDFITVCFTK